MDNFSFLWKNGKILADYIGKKKQTKEARWLVEVFCLIIKRSTVSFFMDFKANLTASRV